MYSSAKMESKEVVEMYRGKPYIRHEIVLYSPLEDKEALKMFQERPELIEDRMEEMNQNIEEEVGEMFESDIRSIYSGVQNLYRNDLEE